MCSAALFCSASTGKSDNSKNRPQRPSRHYTAIIETFSKYFHSRHYTAIIETFSKYLHSRHYTAIIETFSKYFHSRHYTAIIETFSKYLHSRHYTAIVETFSKYLHSRHFTAIIETFSKYLHIISTVFAFLSCLKIQKTQRTQPPVGVQCEEMFWLKFALNPDMSIVHVTFPYTRTSVIHCVKNYYYLIKCFCVYSCAGQTKATSQSACRDKKKILARSFGL